MSNDFEERGLLYLKILAYSRLNSNFSSCVGSSTNAGTHAVVKAESQLYLKGFSIYMRNFFYIC